MDHNKYCVIMAGGIGSRFWPISRNSKPKQFLDILGMGKSFIRMTFERFAPIIPNANFLVVTNTAYKDLVLEELPELEEHQVLCEPVGRNTAPCIAYAAMRLRAINPNADMIVTPSDHLITNEVEFRSVINECIEFSRDHSVLMTIGIKPSRPDTGYGYIQIDKVIDSDYPEINRVKLFTEKPNSEVAKVFLESGEFFWNSGIFVWRIETIINALKELQPQIYNHFDSIAKHYNTPQEQNHIDTIYPECRGISIDFGIMELAQNVHVRRSDFGWSDIGTWGALYDYSSRDEQGNVTTGQTIMYNTKNSIIKIPQGKLAVVEGLEDYIVADHENVLMICPRENEQNIKKYIEETKFQQGKKFI